jgi:hypothetical protein
MKLKISVFDAFFKIVIIIDDHINSEKEINIEEVE